MNWQGLAALISALSLFIPVLVKALFDLKRLRSDYKNIWHGIVARGYVEAISLGHLVMKDGQWHVSEEARNHYGPIAPQLRTIRHNLKVKMGREPSDDELTWAVEQDASLQQWMVDNGCPALGINQHGCLAIACIISVSAPPPA